jgi:hypothetical protein
MDRKSFVGFRDSPVAVNAGLSAGNRFSGFSPSPPVKGLP